MKIGNVQIDSPFVLAPLAGVSDSPFRHASTTAPASALRFRAPGPRPSIDSNDMSKESPLITRRGTSGAAMKNC